MLNIGLFKKPHLFQLFLSIWSCWTFTIFKILPWIEWCYTLMIFFLFLFCWLVFCCQPLNIWCAVHLSLIQFLLCTFSQVMLPIFISSPKVCVYADNSQISISNPKFTLNLWSNLFSALLKYPSGENFRDLKLRVQTWLFSHSSVFELTVDLAPLYQSGSNQKRETI